MKSILVASDLSPRADRALRRAFDLAAEHGARLTVASIVDQDLPDDLREGFAADIRARLERFAASIDARRGVAHEIQVEPGDPSADIPRLAAEAEADLIILGRHRDRPFMDLIRETTMERIVRFSPVPVLLVREPSDHPYKKVLLAVDFSPASAEAARLTERLLPKAQISGFHAVHIAFQGLVGPNGHAADARFYLGAARRELESWARSEALPHIEEQTHVLEGGVHQVMHRRIRDLSPDLLAVGAHGRSGAAPFAVGSFANDLMRDPPCDLLIARARPA
ncbi:MAG: universal stress protein [Rhodobacteraceae bacterium]|nr:universal stress protein [Paracoccaceae bacterium]